MAGGIGTEFMSKTRYAHLGMSDQMRGVPPPPVVNIPHGKEETIELPSPGAVSLAPLDFGDLVAQRSSLRSYSPTPLSQEEISFLLWCTQGLKERHGELATIRNVPSAGARHAFETIVLANRVTGLEPGLYGYLALSHGLLPMDQSPNIGERITEACHGQAFVRTSATTFLWVAIPYRMTWRYGERGYRYLHLDAGHVCQNLYLAAEAIGGGACAVAAFDDDALNAILGLDDQTSFTIYLAAVGKRD